MDAAYGNIGLEANTTWRDAPDDAFQRSSDNLWVKLNYLREKKHHQVGENGKLVTVRDVIPQSKLARYGHYSYDNGREMMYNREKPLQFFDDRNAARSRPEDPHEPWMLSDVEHEFRRLTQNSSQPYDLYYGFKPIDCVQVEESIQEKYPVLAKKCQPHDVDAEDTLERIRLPNPFYRIDDLNQLELQMRITSTKHIWENPVKSLVYLINAQKYIEQFGRGPVPEGQFVPSPNGRGSSFGPPPSATASPPSLHPSFRATVDRAADSGLRQARRTPSKSLRPAEGRDIFPTVKKRPSGEGRDFANLTLLTRPVNRRENSVPDHSTLHVPDSVLKWLQTGYPTRSKELTAIQNLSDELRNVRHSLQNYNVFSGKDRHGRCSDEPIGSKFHFSWEPNAFTSLEHLAYRSEKQSTSLSSSSSSDQNRSRPTAGHHIGKTLGPAGSSTASQLQGGEPWSSNPAPLFGTPPPDAPFRRNRLVQKCAPRTTCRPILNSQYREAPDERAASYGGGIVEKGSPTGGMADGSASGHEGNAFDDLERQAIEQWPSDDSVDIFRSHRFQKTGNASKRKSAVQMLQETKAFYVKSETVLDKKQEFKPGRVPETVYGIAFQTNPKDTNLQDRLRMLLDFDAVESRHVRRRGYGDDFEGRKKLEQNTCFQHKSLPDLHVSPSCSSTETSDSSFNIKCDGDSRSAYSSMTQPLELDDASPQECKRCLKSSATRRNRFQQTRSRLYASFRVAKSGEFADSTSAECRSHRRRRSNASSCNRSRHNSSSKHSQSADSGRRSQGGSLGLRTGRSGLPEFPEPPPRPAKPAWSDSGTEEDFPPLYRSGSLAADKKRAPIHRSKSDVSGKCIQLKETSVSLEPPVPPSLHTNEKLEFFFDHLGMDPSDFKELASNNSGNSCSPVYLSSVSSLDSCADAAGWDVPEPCKQADHPSIVERNARIIKWLFNCRKFQKPIVNEEKPPLES